MCWRCRAVVISTIIVIFIVIMVVIVATATATITATTATTNGNRTNTNHDNSTCPDGGGNFGGFLEQFLEESAGEEVAGLGQDAGELRVVLLDEPLCWCGGVLLGRVFAA